jgi:hypothetical protein
MARTNNNNPNTKTPEMWATKNAPTSPSHPVSQPDAQLLDLNGFLQGAKKQCIVMFNAT